MNSLIPKIERRVRASLKEQGALLNEEQIKAIVDFKIDELIELLVESFYVS